MKVKEVDIFIQSVVLPTTSFKLDQLLGWKCTDVFNRGTRVGPEGTSSCHLTDVFQCRFSHESGAKELKDVSKLLENLTQQNQIWTGLHIIWCEI